MTALLPIYTKCILFIFVITKSLIRDKCISRYINIRLSISRHKCALKRTNIFVILANKHRHDCRDDQKPN